MAKASIPENGLYPSNSKTKKDKKDKKVEKVISGSVKSGKQPLKTKLAHTFLSDDVDDVKGYIFFEVIVPEIKNTILDASQKALEMLFFGTTSRSKVGGKYVEYNRSSINQPKRAQSSTRPKDFRDFTYETRADAEEVLINMQDLIDEYGFASIGDLYDLSGETGKWTDEKYGWADLRGAKVSMKRGGGYSITFPRPEQLD